MNKEIYWIQTAELLVSSPHQRMPEIFAKRAQCFGIQETQKTTKTEWFSSLASHIWDSELKKLQAER
jgi:hypothetical protein